MAHHRHKAAAPKWACILHVSGPTGASQRTISNLHAGRSMRSSNPLRVALSSALSAVGSDSARPPKLGTQGLGCMAGREMKQGMSRLACTWRSVFRASRTSRRRSEPTPLCHRLCSPHANNRHRHTHKPSAADKKGETARRPFCAAASTPGWSTLASQRRTWRRNPAMSHRKALSLVGPAGCIAALCRTGSRSRTWVP